MRKVDDKPDKLWFRQLAGVLTAAFLSKIWSTSLIYSNDSREYQPLYSYISFHSQPKRTQKSPKYDTKVFWITSTIGWNPNRFQLSIAPLSVYVVFSWQHKTTWSDMVQLVRGLKCIIFPISNKVETKKKNRLFKTYSTTETNVCLHTHPKMISKIMIEKESFFCKKFLFMYCVWRIVFALRGSPLASSPDSRKQLVETVRAPILRDTSKEINEWTNDEVSRFLFGPIQ